MPHGSVLYVDVNIKSSDVSQAGTIRKHICIEVFQAHCLHLVMVTLPFQGVVTHDDL